eukprot:EG_transcript_7566
MLLVVVSAALAYWAVCVGGPMLSLGLVWIRGYTEDEMFTARELFAIPHRKAEGPRELQALIPQPLKHIPPILHRTWKSANLSTMPALWRKGYESCAGLHGNWTVYLWTDAAARALIADSYAWFLPTYDGYRYPIQRVDAMRYFILYHYGGVYLDLDIGCSSRLDPLLAAVPPGVALFPETEPLGVSNDLMLTPQRHPFFLHLIQSLSHADHWYGSNYPTILFSTGPAFVSSSLYHAPPWLRGGFRILEHALYGNRPRSFFFHMRGSSWHSTDADFIKWVAGGAAGLQAIGLGHSGLIFMVVPTVWLTCLLCTSRRRFHLPSHPKREECGLGAV